MKTKYDWSKVPHWVWFIAKDKNEEVYGYTDSPELYPDFRTMWDCIVDYCWYERLHIQPNFEFDWKDSLEERPDDFK